MKILSWLFRTKKPVASVDVIGSSQIVSQSVPKSTDWNKSEIHLMLLREFLKPTHPSRIIPEQWEAVLGEPPQTTIDRFIEEGLLEPLSLTATIEHCNTVPEIKKMLKDRGLKVTGKKQELIDRLVVNDEIGLSKIYNKKEMLECSLVSRPRILQYIADKELEFNNAVAESLIALRTKDFLKASHAIRSYESKQIRLPVRALQVATVYLDTGRVNDTPTVSYDTPSPIKDVKEDIAELKEIFGARPKILAELAENEWVPLQAVVALSYLLHGNLSMEWLPAEFVGIKRFAPDTTVRMMQRHIYYLRDMKQWRKMGIKQASISGSSLCDECIKIADKVNDLDNLPELPYEKCRGEGGCFCRISPEF